MGERRRRRAEVCMAEAKSECVAEAAAVIPSPVREGRSGLLPLRSTDRERERESDVITESDGEQTGGGGANQMRSRRRGHRK